jgi:hypothetical protein
MDLETVDAFDTSDELSTDEVNASDEPDSARSGEGNRPA